MSASYFDFTIGHQQPYKLELGASEGKLYEIYPATSAGAQAASAARLLVGAGKDLARRNPHLYSAARQFRDGIRAGIRRYKRLSLDGNCEFYQALYALALRYTSRLIRREVNWMISGRKPAAAVFEQVYTERRWADERSAFHWGRALASELYASTISKFISEHQIRSVVDLGCGDFRVAQLLVNDSIDYTGIDIVAPLIAHNEARFASHNVRFLCLDIISDELPRRRLMPASRSTAASFKPRDHACAAASENILM